MSIFMKYFVSILSFHNTVSFKFSPVLQQHEKNTKTFIHLFLSQAIPEILLHDYKSGTKPKLVAKILPTDSGELYMLGLPKLIANISSPFYHSIIRPILNIFFKILHI